MRHGVEAASWQRISPLPIVQRVCDGLKRVRAGWRDERDECCETEEKAKIHGFGGWDYRLWSGLVMSGCTIDLFDYSVALRWDPGSGSEHAFRTQRATGLSYGLPSLLTNLGRVRRCIGVESSKVNPPGNRRPYNKVFRACDFSAVSVCDGLFSGSEPGGTAIFTGDGGDGS